MPERVQYNFIPVDILAQAVISPANSPLPLARLQPGKFLDVVLSAPVVRVFCEDQA